MGIILVFIFGIMTIMGVLSWWYAAHYNGLIGTTRILSIISIIGLLFSFWFVYKNGWSSAKPRTATTQKVNVSSNQYFAQKNAESESVVKQHQAEQNILKQLRKSYATNVGTVSFNEQTKTYTVTPTKASYVKSVTTMWKYPTTNAKSINSMAANYVKMSKSVDKALNGSYTLRVKRSQNGPVILSIKNGHATIMNKGTE